MSWGWQELIDPSQAPAPLGADHSSTGWRVQDWRPRHVTLLRALEAPPPEFWQRGLPTTLPPHSMEHSARHIINAQWTFDEFKFSEVPWMEQRNRLCNWHHPLVREKDRVTWTVCNLTFKGRHKSDLISFQGNKFYKMSLPSAFCDIHQASMGFFFFSSTGWSPYFLAKYTQSPTIWP